ncbi:MAG: glycoside hydrolase family 97 protein [Calditrichia bacterium]
MRFPLGFLFCAFLLQSAAADSLQVASPSNILQLQFFMKNNRPFYRVQRFGNEVIKPSRLGLILKNSPSFAWGLSPEAHRIRSVDETWEQVWGEKREIRNHYNELQVDLKGDGGQRLTLRFRVYDDGIGFRYEVPEQSGLKDFEIMDELTEFRFTGDHTAWWIGAYQGNRYEYLYQQTPLSQTDTVHTPVTLETKDGLYLSIHEAALTDFASMTLARSGRYTYTADLVPWWDGVKVKTQTPMKSPWRTIQISDSPGGLITSYLILNLNEPNQLQDVSWIEPGKYVGIWWEMHIGKASWESGEKHGATTANTKKYIDFAAKYGFKGVLVEGWNQGWDGNWIANGDKFSFTKSYPDFNLQELAGYAKQKGVRLIGHHETATGITNYERQMEDAFNLYQNLGVRVVKTGYVGHGRNIRWTDAQGREHREWHHGQFMVRHYRHVVQEAAKHQIMLDVHEPVKATGIRRTWPNMMTREGARGQEYNAWSGDGGNPPDHTVILTFTRLLGGPMDFTPGIFDIMLDDYRPDNRVNTTLAKQLALYVVIYSPLQMAADLPENYEANPEPFQFIVDVPTDWEDTRVLHARIGDYVTIVRKDRNSPDWFLGSITDENGRLLEAPLGFLDEGKTYVAEIYRDSLTTDWKTNPLPVEITRQLVTSSTVLPLRLAPGGGQAIRFRPAGESDIQRFSK